MKKNALSTSLRSATQATDSTCSGCQANRAATRALRQGAPVIWFSARNSRSVVAMCKPRLVRWWAPGFRPKSRQSSMWESQVSGCQLFAWLASKAQRRPGPLSPACTAGFCVT